VAFKWISEIFTLYKQLMLILGWVTVIAYAMFWVRLSQLF